MASVASPQPSATQSLPIDTPKDDTNLWTAPQESALLQALIRYKPVGMHKHFRMIAIRDHLLQTGLIIPEDSHTSTQGIWRKLGTLYDLERLDEREDSIISEGGTKGAGEADGDEGNGREGDEYWREFELPREDFEALMWQKRFAPDGASALGSSRPQSPATVTGTRRESTVAETDEARSSPVSVSGARSGGRGRGRGGRGGRLSRLQNEVETRAESSKGSRRTSKAPSAVEAEDEVMEDVDDEEEGEDEEGGDDEGSEEQEEDDEEEAGTKKGTATKRGRGGPRGRARRGRRR